MQQAMPMPDLADQLLSWMLRSDPEGAPPTVRQGTEADSIDGHVPTLVAVPHSREQVAAAVRFASTQNMAVAPIGGRTQCHWGGILQRCELLLDLSALNRVVEYEPADLTITVEAGCTLRELQEKLAAYGQFLPIDPAVDEKATVGGLVATQATGPSRQGYGTLRDYLLGACLVRANGDLVKSGSRVVKSAAGYELHKLLLGSLGTLGILVELTFMVRPLPRDRRMLFIPLPHLAVAEPLLATLLDAQLEPHLLELLNQPALRLLPEGLLPSEATSLPYGLFVGLAGSPSAVEWQVGHLAELTASLPTRPKEALTLHSTPWEPAHEALLAARSFPAEALVCRAALLSSQVSSFVEQAEGILTGRGIASPILAHAGCGMIHLLLPSDAEEAASVVEELRQAASLPPFTPDVPASLEQSSAQTVGLPLLESPGLGDLAALRGLRAGRLVVESAPAHIRKKLSVWGAKADHHALSAGLKAKLDPQGLLNPGRM